MVAGSGIQSWDAHLKRMSLIIKSDNLVVETEVLKDFLVLQTNHCANNQGGRLRTPRHKERRTNT